jgi:diguanylate cyclase (GGDEF)-like protein/PAS domain S-box-containing protein
MGASAWGDTVVADEHVDDGHARRRSALSDLRSRVAAILPRGGTLPTEVWERRHRGILVLLWLHVPGVAGFALVRDQTLAHSLTEASAVALFAIVATWLSGSVRSRSVAASLGLLTASAALVHLSEGVIEVHFHFFVMVAVITLYQEWRTFMVAIGYVVLQHGVMGQLAPESVYNHEAAIQGPWTWAAIHGLFILGMSAVGIVSWRLNESLVVEVSDRESRLAEAQRVALLGSWEWDVRNDLFRWSDEQFRLFGLAPDGFGGTFAAVRALIHPDDSDVFDEQVARALAQRGAYAFDHRIVARDGDVRWHHARGEVTSTHADGTPRTMAGTSQDITDRHRWEQALRDSEEGLKATLSLLSATLDSTHDGILVVDAAGKITSFNQKFVEMWQIPGSVLDTRDDGEALAFVLSQLKDPDAFLAKVNELYAQPDADSHDSIEFRDGRVFERYSTPQCVGGVAVGRVWSFRDVTNQRNLERELAHRAFHDSLTGLPNQVLFHERVNHAIARRPEGSAQLAVLFLDLDNFKTVNDSLGHPVGDQLLVAVARRLEACLRSADTAARLGGDEFVILLEGEYRPTEVVATAERILQVLRKPFTIGGKEVFLSTSVGVAFGGPEAQGSDVLLRNADLAMYRAKAEGKDCYQVFEPAMHAAVLDRLDLEADLRRAVEREEFVVHYQPIVAVATGALMGVEALVRWNHPVRGLLMPDAFIPVAEETGLVNDIGHVVLDRACDQVSAWQRAFPVAAALRLNVNTSASQLTDPLLPHHVTRALRRSGLAPADLTLEITEGALVQSADSDNQLGVLKKLGVLLAIDDFGTGYSSLSYLQRFPVDELKIDKSFIGGLGGGAEEEALPRAIIRLAQSLRVLAVAEGVETQEQLEQLRVWGCDLAQGYHFARPVSDAAFGDYLESLAPQVLQVPRAPERIPASVANGA